MLSNSLSCFILGPVQCERDCISSVFSACHRTYLLSSSRAEVVENSGKMLHRRSDRRMGDVQTSSRVQSGTFTSNASPQRRVSESRRCGGLSFRLVDFCKVSHTMSISVKLTSTFLKTARRSTTCLGVLVLDMYSPQGEKVVNIPAASSYRYTVLWIVSGCGQRLNHIGPSCSNKTKLYIKCGIRSSGFFCS